MSSSKSKRVPSYEEFEAVNLFCPTCRRALPVRKNLLLVLPDGDIFEYRCSRCNTLVGKKKGDSSLQAGAILPEV